MASNEIRYAIDANEKTFREAIQKAIAQVLRMMADAQNKALREDVVRARENSNEAET